MDTSNPNALVEIVPNFSEGRRTANDCQAR